MTRSSLFSPQSLSALFIVLWSSAWIAGKIGLQFAGPLTLLVIRLCAAALVLLLVAWLTGAPWPRRWIDYGHLAVAGLLIHGLTLASLYIGLSDGVSAGVSALIAGLTPLCTALAAGPLLHERVGAGRWTGLTIGLLGVALVVMNKISFATGRWEGYAVTFLALAAFVLGTLYQKKFCSAIDLRTGNLVQFGVAGVVLLLPALCFEGLHVEWSEALIASSAWLALVNSIVAVSLLYFLLRQGGKPCRDPVLSRATDHHRDGFCRVSRNAQHDCGCWLRSGGSRGVFRFQNERSMTSTTRVAAQSVATANTRPPGH